ncbi:hypothetical protein [Pseudosulfitobacter sp. DSM 107133]|uniref:hypothetical protein n=1 Tax=Pseudosulfitobacter sp. DSM 107133 TaxID=2883100 RepID=UPI0013B46559|nr:hypothetical protein [Pseudosulfitobacter sp. DSM 107133]
MTSAKAQSHQIIFGNQHLDEMIEIVRDLIEAVLKSDAVWVAHPDFRIRTIFIVQAQPTGLAIQSEWDMSPAKTTVFDSSGLSVQDLYVARAVLERVDR